MMYCRDAGSTKYAIFEMAVQQAQALILEQIWLRPAASCDFSACSDNNPPWRWLPHIIRRALEVSKITDSSEWANLCSSLQPARLHEITLLSSNAAKLHGESSCIFAWLVAGQSNRKNESKNLVTSFSLDEIHFGMQGGQTQRKLLLHQACHPDRKNTCVFSSVLRVVLWFMTCFPRCRDLIQWP